MPRRRLCWCGHDVSDHKQGICQAYVDLKLPVPGEEPCPCGEFFEDQRVRPAGRSVRGRLGTTRSRRVSAVALRTSRLAKRVGWPAVLAARFIDSAEG